MVKHNLLHINPYLESFAKYTDLRDKRRNINLYVRTTINRLLALFKYGNLPDTIPQREMELMLMCGGCGAIVEHQNNLYFVHGGFGADLDAYGRSREFLVNNPYIKLNKRFKIDEDCVLWRNDYLTTGLMPVIVHWSTLISENDLSLYLCTIAQRIQNIITAGDDTQKQSADKFFEDIEKGKFGAVVSNEFFEGIKTSPLNTSSGGAITQLIELEQYLRAGLFSEIGLNANFNMKKQSMHNAEVGLNEEGLLPLIDEMLALRKEAAQQTNEMFGTNITVELSSAWEQQREEIDLKDELLEAQIDATEAGEEVPSTSEENGAKGGEQDDKNEND